MRLNLFIARSGYASRRGADTLIKAGKVKVAGQIVREPFFRVDESDKVEIGANLLSIPKYVYVIFNKPCGVTTTTKDRFADKKVTDFFPKELGKIYPAGRLDKDSCGLLILTNDGDLCYRLTHPKFAVEKEYLVKVKGVLKLSDCKRAVAGVKDKDGFLKVKKIQIINRACQESFCRVVVAEGKKRHLRRLFKALGFSVIALQRVRVGGVCLGTLGEGEYKIVSKDKINFY